MIKTVDFNADVRLKVLAYGVAGSAKTSFCASAQQDPRTAPALLIDVGGNSLSLRRLPQDQRPTTLMVSELSDLNLIYDYFAAGQKPNHPFLKATNLPHTVFKTLIFDGVTGLQRLSFEKVSGVQTKGPGDIPNQIERQHFNIVLAHMTRFASLFFSLPVHVLVTALERELEDTATGRISYGPMLLGQSAGEVAGYAYIVMRMVHRLRLASETQKQAADKAVGPDQQAVSVGLLAPNPAYVAKDQHGVNKSFLANPTVTQILDAMGVPIPS